MPYKCSECGKTFWTGKKAEGKGYKLKPKPLCSECVRANTIITCSSCNKVFRAREGWWDECWSCRKPVCSFCGSKITIKGIDFYFCKEHKNYDLKKLKQDADDLLEEEKKLEVKALPEK